MSLEGPLSQSVLPLSFLSLTPRPFERIRNPLILNILFFLKAGLATSML